MVTSSRSGDAPLPWEVDAEVPVLPDAAEVFGDLPGGLIDQIIEVAVDPATPRGDVTLLPSLDQLLQDEAGGDSDKDGQTGETDAVGDADGSGPAYATEVADASDDEVSEEDFADDPESFNGDDGRAGDHGEGSDSFELLDGDGDADADDSTVGEWFQ